MKPVFSPEVAQDLGYQKYWPERSDWVLATVGCLAFLGVVVGVAFLVAHLFGAQTLITKP